MPLLPQTFYYVCIDLPSHGKSSRFPGNLPIHTMDYLLVYKIILDYFDRKKYIIIGHSYGGQIGIHFAQIYPQYIIKLILLDSVFLFPYTVSSYRSHVQSIHSEYMKFLKNVCTPETQPTYTYEEAIAKVISSRRYGDVTREAAIPMLKRNSEITADGRYRFTNDSRLKFFMNPGFNMRMEIELIQKYPIECPHLIIFALNTPQWQYFKPVINALKKNKLCKIKYVEGDHDVHNINPEIVSPHVSAFLLSKKSKL